MDNTLQFISTQWNHLGAFFAFDPVLLSEPGIVFRLVLLVVLLCGSAFFSGSETALFSLSRLDLRQLRRERNAGDQKGDDVDNGPVDDHGSRRDADKRHTG